MLFNSNAKDYKQRPNLSTKNTIEQINILKNNNYSSFLNMYFLNRNTIVALYMINYKPYIELFNIDDGSSVLRKSINIPYHMAYAQNDTIYLMKQAGKLDKDGNLPNPTILKYKYNGK
jgi:penicillin-binding protein-related factor A (putative recombinase)